MKRLIILISSLSLITPSSAENQTSLNRAAELILNAFSTYESKGEFQWRDLSPALHEISIHGHSLSEETQNQLESNPKYR